MSTTLMEKRISRLKVLAIILAGTVVTAAIVTLVNVQKSINSNHKKLEQEVQLQKIMDERKQQELEQNQSQIKENLQKEIDTLKQQVQAKKTKQAALAASKPVYTTVQATVNSAKMFIYMHESGNNPGAINRGSGACGLGQALPCSKMNCSLSDYGCQDAWFTNYMKSRYGTWENAMAFWISHKWW